MSEHSSNLNSLLQHIRGHSAFPELLLAVHLPPMPVYDPKKSSALDNRHLDWAYASGRLKQNEHWDVLLAGSIERAEQVRNQGK